MQVSEISPNAGSMLDLRTGASIPGLVIHTEARLVGLGGATPLHLPATFRFENSGSIAGPSRLGLTHGCGMKPENPLIYGIVSITTPIWRPI